MPVLVLMKNSSPRQLRNVDYVEALIRTFGIVYEARCAYGLDNQYMVSPSQTGIYQTPIQLAEFLVEISHKRLSSYLEVGVYKGGNFLFVSNYLKMFNPFIICTALDIVDLLNEDTRDLVNVTIGTTENLKKQKFDLVFIDADHEYNEVRADFMNVGQHAKYCAFHDINDESCPGPSLFWGEIKHLYKSKEFTKHSLNQKVHGIGLMQLR